MNLKSTLSYMFLGVMGAKSVAMISGMLFFILCQNFYGADVLGEYVTITSLLIGVVFPMGLALNSHFQREASRINGLELKHQLSGILGVSFVFSSLSLGLLFILFRGENVVISKIYYLVTVLYAPIFLFKHSLLGVIKNSGRMMVISIVDVFPTLLLCSVITFIFLKLDTASPLKILITTFFLAEVFCVFFMTRFCDIPTLKDALNIGSSLSLAMQCKERACANIAQAMSIYGLVVISSFIYGPAIAGFLKILERLAYVVNLPAIASNQIIVRDSNRYILEKNQNEYDGLFRRRANLVVLVQLVIAPVLLLLLHLAVGFELISTVPGVNVGVSMVCFVSAYVYAAVLKWPFLRASLTGNVQDMLRATVYGILLQILALGCINFFNLPLVIFLFVYPTGIFLPNYILNKRLITSERMIWQ